MEEMRELCESSNSSDNEDDDDDDDDDGHVNTGPTNLASYLEGKDKKCKSLPVAKLESTKAAEIHQQQPKRIKLDEDILLCPERKVVNPCGGKDDCGDTQSTTIKMQQEEMKQIAKDARKTSKSCTAQSELRREAMKKIVKETINADVITKKKTTKRVTILNKMESEKTQHGPMRILHDCMKYGIKAKVWIRRYKGLRGVITGYIVAFDLHMNLAMIDINEVYTIETWMVGEPVPKNRRNKKKNNCSVVDIVGKENKVTSVLKDAPITVVKEKLKKQSTIDYLKQLTEKMKSNPKPEPARTSEPVSTSEPVNTSGAVITLSESSSEVNKQTSLISDDLWSVLQKINVGNTENRDENIYDNRFCGSKTSHIGLVPLTSHMEHSPSHPHMQLPSSIIHAPPVTSNAQIPLVPSVSHIVAAHSIPHMTPPPSVLHIAPAPAIPHMGQPHSIPHMGPPPSCPYMGPSLSNSHSRPPPSIQFITPVHSNHQIGPLLSHPHMGPPPSNSHMGPPLSNPHMGPPPSIPHMVPILSSPNMTPIYSNPHIRPPSNPHIGPPSNLHIGPPPGTPHMRPPHSIPHMAPPHSISHLVSVHHMPTVPSIHHMIPVPLNAHLAPLPPNSHMAPLSGNMHMASAPSTSHIVPTVPQMTPLSTNDHMATAPSTSHMASVYSISHTGTAPLICHSIPMSPRMISVTSIPHIVSALSTPADSDPSLPNAVKEVHSSVSIHHRDPHVSSNMVNIASTRTVISISNTSLKNSLLTSVNVDTSKSEIQEIPDAVRDPRLSKKRDTCVSQIDYQKQSIKQRGLSSNLNLTAMEKAVILCNYGMTTQSNGSPTNISPADYDQALNKSPSKQKLAKQKQKSKKRASVKQKQKSVECKMVLDDLSDLKDIVMDTDSDDNENGIECAIMSAYEMLPESTWLTTASVKPKKNERRVNLSLIICHKLEQQIEALREQEVSRKQQLEEEAKIEMSGILYKSEKRGKAKDTVRLSSKVKSSKKLKDLTEMDIQKILGSIHENKDTNSKEDIIVKEKVKKEDITCASMNEVGSHGHEDDLYNDIIMNAEKEPLNSNNMQKNGKEKIVNESMDQDDMWNDAVFSSVGVSHDSTKKSRGSKQKKDVHSEKSKMSGSDIVPKIEKDYIQSPFSTTNKTFVTVKGSARTKGLITFRNRLNKEEENKVSILSNKMQVAVENVKKDLCSIPENEMLDVDSTINNKCTFIFHSVAKRLKDIKTARPLPRIEGKILQTVFTKMTPLFETTMMKGELSSTDEESYCNSNPAVSTEIINVDKNDELLHTDAEAAKHKSKSRKDKKVKKKKTKKGKRKKYKNEKGNISADDDDDDDNESIVASRLDSVSPHHLDDNMGKSRLESVSPDQLEDGMEIDRLDSVSPNPLDDSIESHRLESVSPDPLDESDKSSDTSDEIHCLKSSGGDSFHKNRNEKEEKTKYKSKKNQRDILEITKYQDNIVRKHKKAFEKESDIQHHKGKKNKREDKSRQVKNNSLEECLEQKDVHVHKTSQGRRVYENQATESTHQKNKNVQEATVVFEGRSHTDYSSKDSDARLHGCSKKFGLTDDDKKQKYHRDEKHKLKKKHEGDSNIYGSSSPQRRAYKGVLAETKKDNHEKIRSKKEEMLQVTIDDNQLNYSTEICNISVSDVSHSDFSEEDIQENGTPQKQLDLKGKRCNQEKEVLQEDKNLPKNYQSRKKELQENEGLTTPDYIQGNEGTEARYECTSKESVCEENRLFLEKVTLIECTSNVTDIEMLKQSQHDDISESLQRHSSDERHGKSIDECHPSIKNKYVLTDIETQPTSKDSHVQTRETCQEKEKKCKSEKIIESLIVIDKNNICNVSSDTTHLSVQHNISGMAEAGEEQLFLQPNLATQKLGKDLKEISGIICKHSNNEDSNTQVDISETGSVETNSDDGSMILSTQGPFDASSNKNEAVLVDSTTSFDSTICAVINFPENCQSQKNNGEESERLAKHDCIQEDEDNQGRNICISKEKVYEEKSLFQEKISSGEYTSNVTDIEMPKQSQDDDRSGLIKESIQSHSSDESLKIHGKSFDDGHPSTKYFASDIETVLLSSKDSSDVQTKDTYNEEEENCKFHKTEDVLFRDDGKDKVKISGEYSQKRNVVPPDTTYLSSQHNIPSQVVKKTSAFQPNLILNKINFKPGENERNLNLKFGISETASVEIRSDDGIVKLSTSHGPTSSDVSSNKEKEELVYNTTSLDSKQCLSNDMKYGNEDIFQTIKTDGSKINAQIPNIYPPENIEEYHNTSKKEDAVLGGKVVSSDLDSSSENDMVIDIDAEIGEDNEDMSTGKNAKHVTVKQINSFSQGKKNSNSFGDSDLIQVADSKRERELEHPPDFETGVSDKNTEKHKHNFKKNVNDNRGEDILEQCQPVLPSPKKVVSKCPQTKMCEEAEKYEITVLAETELNSKAKGRSSKRICNKKQEIINNCNDNEIDKCQGNAQHLNMETTTEETENEIGRTSIMKLNDGDGNEIDKCEELAQDSVKKHIACEQTEMKSTRSTKRSSTRTRGVTSDGNDNKTVPVADTATEVRESKTTRRSSKRIDKKNREVKTDDDNGSGNGRKASHDSSRVDVVMDEKQSKTTLVKRASKRNQGIKMCDGAIKTNAQHDVAKLNVPTEEKNPKVTRKSPRKTCNRDQTILHGNDNEIEGSEQDTIRKINAANEEVGSKTTFKSLEVCNKMHGVVSFWDNKEIDENKKGGDDAKIFSEDENDVMNFIDKTEVEKIDPERCFKITDNEAEVCETGYEVNTTMLKEISAENSGEIANDVIIREERGIKVIHCKKDNLTKDNLTKDTEKEVSMQIEDVNDKKFSDRKQLVQCDEHNKKEGKTCGGDIEPMTDNETDFEDIVVEKNKNIGNRMEMYKDDTQISTCSISKTIEGTETKNENNGHADEEDIEDMETIDCNQNHNSEGDDIKEVSSEDIGDTTVRYEMCADDIDANPVAINNMGDTKKYVSPKHEEITEMGEYASNAERCITENISIKEEILDVEEENTYSGSVNTIIGGMAVDKKDVDLYDMSDVSNNVRYIQDRIKKERFIIKEENSYKDSYIHPVSIHKKHAEICNISDCSEEKDIVTDKIHIKEEKCDSEENNTCEDTYIDVVTPCKEGSENCKISESTDEGHNVAHKRKYQFDLEGETFCQNIIIDAVTVQEGSTEIFDISDVSDGDENIADKIVTNEVLELAYENPEYTKVNKADAEVSDISEVSDEEENIADKIIIEKEKIGMEEKNVAQLVVTHKEAAAISGVTGEVKDISGKFSMMEGGEVLKDAEISDISDVSEEERNIVGKFEEILCIQEDKNDQHVHKKDGGISDISDVGEEEKCDVGKGDARIHVVEENNYKNPIIEIPEVQKDADELSDISDMSNQAKNTSNISDTENADLSDGTSNRDDDVFDGEVAEISEVEDDEISEIEDDEISEDNDDEISEVEISSVDESKISDKEEGEISDKEAGEISDKEHSEISDKEHSEISDKEDIQVPNKKEAKIKGSKDIEHKAPSSSEMKLEKEDGEITEKEDGEISDDEEKKIDKEKEKLFHKSSGDRRKSSRSSHRRVKERSHRSISKRESQSVLDSDFQLEKDKEEFMDEDVALPQKTKSDVRRSSKPSRSSSHENNRGKRVSVRDTDIRSSSQEKSKEVRGNDLSTSTRSLSHKRSREMRRNDQATSNRSSSHEKDRGMRGNDEAMPSRSHSHEKSREVRGSDRDISTRSCAHRETRGNDQAVSTRSTHEKSKEIKGNDQPVSSRSSTQQKSMEARKSHRDVSKQKKWDGLPPHDLRKKLQSDRIKLKIEQAVRHLQKREVTQANELHKKLVKQGSEDKKLKKGVNKDSVVGKREVVEQSRKSSRSESKERLKVEIHQMEKPTARKEKPTKDSSTSQKHEDKGIDLEICDKPGMNLDAVQRYEEKWGKSLKKVTEISKKSKSSCKVPETKEISVANMNLDAVQRYEEKWEKPYKKDKSSERRKVATDGSDLKENETTLEVEEIEKNQEESEKHQESEEELVEANEDVSELNPFQRRKFADTTLRRMKRTCAGTEKITLHEENQEEQVRSPEGSKTRLNFDSKEPFEGGFLARRMHHRMQVVQERELLQEKRDREIRERIMKDIASKNCQPPKQIKGSIFKQRHVNQLFIRGDNIVMVAYEQPEHARKIKELAAGTGVT